MFEDIDGVRVEYDDSFVVIRASNTSPNLTVRMEAITKEKLDSLKNEYLKLLDSLVGE